MIKKIIDGVCTAISGEFGEKYSIYTEKIEQGFKRPTFFVEVKKSSMELFRGDRYFMQNKIMITYYPKYKGKNEDMLELMYKMVTCLEYIEVEGEPLRCGICRFEANGDCLECELEINLFVKKTAELEEADLMEEYTLRRDKFGTDK